MQSNELKITGRVLETHVNGRTGEMITDGHQQVEIAIGIGPLVELMHEAINLMIAQLTSNSPPPEKKPSRESNGSSPVRNGTFPSHDEDNTGEVPA